MEITQVKSSQNKICLESRVFGIQKKQLESKVSVQQMATQSDLIGPNFDIFVGFNGFPNQYK
jgi:hypothetical protein